MPGAEGQPFENRTDAGQQLVKALAGVIFHDPVVLALPRGGVPLGCQVAKHLRAPLDLLLVRKIGAPNNGEYAIGAVIEGTPPLRVIDAEAVRYTGATEDYIEAEARRQVDVIARRRALYFSGRRAIEIEGRDVIVVDDGIATGSTVRASLKGLRGRNVASVTLAIPVAPFEVAAKLEEEVDRMICLERSRRFSSVGEYFRDFRQLADKDVIALLDTCAQPERDTSPLRSEPS